MTDEQIFCLNGESPIDTWTAPFGIKYTPSREQLNAHLSDSPVRLLAGGYGSGKTTCLLVEIMRQIESHGARHIAVICDYSVQCHRMIDGLYKLHRSECGKYLFSRSPFRVELGFPVDSDEQTVTFERASIVFSAGFNDFQGHQFDFLAIQTSNGDISSHLARAPRAKRIMIDFNPGDRLRGDYLQGNLEIFRMAPNPSLVKMLGTWDCLCCENPPSIDIPGRAAIEETIRQAKVRELGDAASDPFEMEGGDAMENR
jgi:hypothetical protein